MPTCPTISMRQIPRDEITQKVLAWVLESGPWINSRSNSWELLRNAHSWAPPRPTGPEPLGEGPSSLCFHKPPDDSDSC